MGISAFIGDINHCGEASQVLAPSAALISLSPLLISSAYLTSSHLI
jgi:hypothetical protein